MHPTVTNIASWTGLMLLLRLFLFLISAANIFGDPSVNLLAIGSTTTAILTLHIILGTRVYKMWSVGLIETSFTLNLTILTVASYHVRVTKGNKNAATFTSISIVLATFTGIVIYHSVQQIKDARWLRKILYKLSLSSKTPGHQTEKKSELDYEDSADRPLTAPTMTVIDLRELHSDELQEPCMDTNQ